MASGIDIAGIVLAAVPLLVAACERYAEGLETIKRWWRFEREISNVKRILIAEQVILQTTCERLLEGIVSPSRLDHLLENAGSPEWKDDDLERRLKRRLGKSYGSFISGLRDMETLVHELNKMLDVSEDFQTSSLLSQDVTKQLQRVKYSFSKQRCREILKSLERNNRFLLTFMSQNLELEPLRVRRKWPLTDTVKFQSRAKAIHEALTKCLDCQCETTHLAHLRLQRQEPSATGKSQPNTAIEWMKCPGFSSTCPSPAEVFLAESSEADSASRSSVYMKLDLLQKEDGGPDVSGKASGLSNVQESSRVENSSTQSTARTSEALTETTVWASRNGVRSRISTALSSKSKFPSGAKGDKKRKQTKKAAIKPEDTLTASKSTEQMPTTSSGTKLEPEIGDLCSIFRNISRVRPKSDHFVGYIVLSTTSALSAHASIPPDVTFKQDSFVPLLSLLNQPSFSISRADRLHIAVTIAHSVLQLSHTPWLDETWSIADLLTISSNSSETTADRQSAEIPQTALYLCHTKSKPLTTTYQLPFPLLRCPPIFYLGLALIQLCLNTPLSSLRDSNRDPLDAQGEANIVTDYATATRLVDVVFRKAGYRYTDAVRRCIHCDFDQSTTSLESEEFRRAVFEGVVAPLEEVWGDFKRR